MRALVFVFLLVPPWGHVFCCKGDDAVNDNWKQFVKPSVTPVEQPFATSSRNTFRICAGAERRGTPRQQQRACSAKGFAKGFANTLRKALQQMYANQKPINNQSINQSINYKYKIHVDRLYLWCMFDILIY